MEKEKDYKIVDIPFAVTVIALSVFITLGLNAVINAI